MKHFCFLLLLLFYISGLQAQERKTFDGKIASHPVIFGIRGGININSFGPDIAKVWDTNLKKKSSTGWNIGLIIDCPILECLYFQPGVFYKTKGFKLAESEADFTRQVKGVAQYVQFPLLFSYRYHIKRGMQFEFNLGPYIGIGVAGSVDDYRYDKTGSQQPAPGTGLNPDYTDEKDPEITHRDFFGDDLDTSLGIRKTDLGICFGVGLTVNRFYVGIQYDLGLSNLRNSVCWSSATRFRNKSATLLLGFNLMKN